ncbi:MAG: sigma-54-dependent Fis family transcriptional regulator [Nitrospinae bacterium]|nr:sigma-54-dependent Fis family transcriptional regulator [Nitrospinota bacterium]
MPKDLIFVVDDEEASQVLMKHHLVSDGYEVMPFYDGESCLKELDQKPSVICLDMLMPGLSGLETLKRIKSTARNIPVIMVTNDDVLDSAIEAMKLGAYDYIVKPMDPVRIKSILKKAIEQHSLVEKLNHMQGELKQTYSHKNIIGSDKEMKKVFLDIDKVVDSNINVYLNGESGTGKELVARAVHYSGARAKEPFIEINCGAIPESLQESELFGHEKGAFTGAVETKKGKVELAHGGTLFLDEVADLSPATQVKLLRFVQERKFERVGGVKQLKVDLRIISATNKDLALEVKEGRFRQDLYYRLVVYSISIPALQERKNDIPLLASHFMKKYKHENKNDVKAISPDAMNALMAYNWPGNVRELENVIYRAVVCSDGGSIELNSLTREIIDQEKEITEWKEVESDHLDKKASKFTNSDGLLSLDDAEKLAIQSALDLTGGSFPDAAKKLGVSRATFYRKAKKHEISE